jgi:hypothetical protein
MDILNNSNLTFSTDALTQLSNLSPVPAFHKNEQLKRERLPCYECGLEYSLIKKIKLNKGDDSQNDSKICQIHDHIEADEDGNRLIARKDSLKNTQRNRTLIRLDQSDLETSNAINRETNSKRSSFSAGEITDFNLRQYDLYAGLQRSVADESYGLGDNSNLGHEYNVESEGLLINQPTDKNLIENLQMYSSGSMMSPNFMGQIDAAYQESLQFYLKQKQTKFDQFMKKMEDILSLCTDTSIEAPLNYSEEQDSKPKTLKYIPNKQVSVNKKQKKNGKKRTY